ncbi:MAG: NUDIX hydrolase [Deltaproteobacteria bacterium]|nr:NUDIX hydrolase [Deltaproteobacteria bacterium]
MYQDVIFRFCPVCGGDLGHLTLKEKEPQRLVCSRCDFVFYLDPKVVACSIVEMDGRIVLLKRDIEPQRGKWVLPGGYVDRGEEVTAAAIRETEEECGLLTHINKLLGVYSYPGQMAVVVVYIAECLSGNLVAADESQEAGLYCKKDVPWEQLAFRSTADALRDYIKQGK